MLKGKVMAFVLAGVFSFASFQLLAEGKSKKFKMSANARKAKMILEKANKTLMGMKGFSATLVTVPAVGKKQESKYYQLNNPDGTIFMRMEMGGKKNPMIFVSNDDGYWYLLGNTAIKLAYMSKMQAKAMANIGLIPKFDNDGKYVVKTGKVGGKECFVVTRQLSEKQLRATIELAKKSIPEDMRKMMEKMKAKIDWATKVPSLTKSYIGRKDYFLYSMSQYNKNGVRISSTNYENVKLNIEPDKKLFKIPKNMKVKIVKTMTDYADVMMEAALGGLKKEEKKK